MLLLIRYGGQNVFISKEEMAKIKDAGVGNGLTLVGFRPVATLKDHHNLRTGLCPDLHCARADYELDDFSAWS